MFHYRSEGETVRQGLNLYPPGDKHNAGFILRLGSFSIRARWSYYRHRLFFGWHWTSAKERETFRQLVEQGHG